VGRPEKLFSAQQMSGFWRPDFPLLRGFNSRGVTGWDRWGPDWKVAQPAFPGFPHELKGEGLTMLDESATQHPQVRAFVQKSRKRCRRCQPVAASAGVCHAAVYTTTPRRKPNLALS